MKESMATVSPQFSMRRMLKDYVEHIYAPAMSAAMEIDQS